MNCSGTHRYYLADVAVVEDEGKVCLLMLCTSCGDAQCKEFQVTKTRSKVRLEKQKEKENEFLQKRDLQSL
jgi:hypothetical protein